MDWLHVVAHSALPSADDEHDYLARVFGPWLGVEEVRHFPAQSQWCLQPLILLCHHAQRIYLDSHRPGVNEFDRKVPGRSRSIVQILYTD